MERMRPDALKRSGGEGDKEPSARAVVSEVPWTGAGRCLPRKIARSHVANGAVNGISARPMSQAEISFANIGVRLTVRKINANECFAATGGIHVFVPANARL